jgi:hypothetical protein
MFYAGAMNYSRNLRTTSDLPRLDRQAKTAEKSLRLASAALVFLNRFARVSRRQP